MIRKIKLLADEAIKLQNKNRMDEVLREISALCDIDVLAVVLDAPADDVGKIGKLCNTDVYCDMNGSALHPDKMTVEDSGGRELTDEWYIHQSKKYMVESGDFKALFVRDELITDEMRKVVKHVPAKKTGGKK